jgi:hypothetical protein
MTLGVPLQGVRPLVAGTPFGDGCAWLVIW